MDSGQRTTPRVPLRITKQSCRKSLRQLECIDLHVWSIKWLQAPTDGQLNSIPTISFPNNSGTNSLTPGLVALGGTRTGNSDTRYIRRPKPPRSHGPAKCNNYIIKKQDLNSIRCSVILCQEVQVSSLLESAANTTSSGYHTGITVSWVVCQTPT